MASAGALSTHPVAGLHGHFGANPFYDPSTTGPTSINHAAVLEKLAQLDGAGWWQRLVSITVPMLAPEIFVSHRFPLDSYAEALAQFRAGVGRKILIEP